MKIWVIQTWENVAASESVDDETLNIFPTFIYAFFREICSKNKIRATTATVNPFFCYSYDIITSSVLHLMC